MQDELATIDVSPLEALGRIKQELDTLEDRLKAMEERRDSVAAAVYMRVRADYETRRRTLRDNPLTAVLSEPTAEPSAPPPAGWYEPTGRRRIVTPD